ncbi:hypothetical protein EVAR_41137_1 [Eumeta japonica]|uniref:Uncharacterized protein n=1 Tax=Eumeta variegata TaxID=151549 RepID=A0A4C1Y9E2_EUMVA|nr:hypothetical protein EVAR_41137_1 [Eumeta japonica]
MEEQSGVRGHGRGGYAVESSAGLQCTPAPRAVPELAFTCAQWGIRSWPPDPDRTRPSLVDDTPEAIHVRKRKCSQTRNVIKRG